LGLDEGLAGQLVRGGLEVRFGRPPPPCRPTMEAFPRPVTSSRAKPAKPLLPCPGPPPVHRSITARCQDIENKLGKQRVHIDEVTDNLRGHRSEAQHESRSLTVTVAEARREREQKRLEEEQSSAHQIPQLQCGSSNPGTLSRGLASLSGSGETTIVWPLRSTLEVARWTLRERTNIADTTGVFTSKEASIRRQEFLFGGTITAGPSQPLPFDGNSDSVMLGEPFSSRHSSDAHVSGPWSARSRPHLAERSYNWMGMTHGERWEGRPRTHIKEPVSAITQASSVAQRCATLAMPPTRGSLHAAGGALSAR